MIILEKLIKEKIPYRYEYPVVVESGKFFFADFLVLNQREKKAFFWEHLGKMDDEEYLPNAIERIKILSRAGVVLGKNLIITMEKLLK